MASEYTKSLIKSFVTLYGADIVRAINNTGLYFPAVIALLSVESANGTSDLAIRANNFGSIKGDSSNGIVMDTTEGNSRTPSRAYFKRYDNFNQFISDFVNVLHEDRYVNAGVFSATSPEDQITSMVLGGYSTMTPKAYLAGGVKDRINATRDIFGLGLISNNVPDSVDIVNNPDQTTTYNVFDEAVNALSGN